MKLGLKDRKILHQLDLNSRESTSKIGRTIGLNKNTVNYRMSLFEKNKLIKNYYSVIDSFKLGYEVLRFYITFQYSTPTIEKEIIEYFKRCKFIWALYTINGWFDLDLIFWIRNRQDFYEFWKATLYRYGDYFQDQKLSFFIGFSSYRNSYLLDDNNVKPLETSFTYIGDQKIRSKLDAIDYDILRIIAPNARISISDIANKLDVTRSLIVSRFNKLTKLDIIKGYRINIDLGQLGYRYYKIDIFLRNYSKRNQIIAYAKQNLHLMGIVETVGFSHIEFEYHLKNEEELIRIVNDISDNFPNSIRSYKYLSVKHIHKLLYLPENIKEIKNPMVTE
ncbi:MAG: AsnC family transcriptional regulator [Candidatus Thermoplasmatota archaeon]|nr:AsnC family transcriptional regulator [Candidatus Thermoplasmatota archaeon]